MIYERRDQARRLLRRLGSTHQKRKALQEDWEGCWPGLSTSQYVFLLVGGKEAQKSFKASFMYNKSVVLSHGGEGTEANQLAATARARTRSQRQDAKPLKEGIWLTTVPSAPLFSFLPWLVTVPPHTHLTPCQEKPASPFHRRPRTALLSDKSVQKRD